MNISSRNLRKFDLTFHSSMRLFFGCEKSIFLHFSRRFSSSFSFSLICCFSQENENRFQVSFFLHRKKNTRQSSENYNEFYSHIFQYTYRPILLVDDKTRKHSLAMGRVETVGAPHRLAPHITFAIYKLIKVFSSERNEN